jgi:hypothetical protein
MQWLARRGRPVTNTRSRGAASALANLDPAEGARSLKSDGVVTGLSLKEDVRSELCDVLSAQPCYGAGDLRYPFLYRNKLDAERRYGQRFLQAHYYGVQKMGTAANRILADSSLNQVLREYFQTDPRLVGMRAWWSFACDASRQERVNAAQRFHYDIDDYLALSVFFYLSDVDSSAGPHIVIRGSHGRKHPRQIWALSRCRTDEEMVQVYGAGKIEMICGKSGTGFIEDSFCFHKGQEPTARDRLVFQLRYALSDYGTGSDATHRE